MRSENDSPVPRPCLSLHYNPSSMKVGQYLEDLRFYKEDFTYSKEQVSSTATLRGGQVWLKNSLTIFIQGTCIFTWCQALKIGLRWIRSSFCPQETHNLVGRWINDCSIMYLIGATLGWAQPSLGSRKASQRRWPWAGCWRTSRRVGATQRQKDHRVQR